MAWEEVLICTKSLYDQLFSWQNFLTLLGSISLDLLPDSKKSQGSTNEIGNHISAEVLHPKLSLLRVEFRHCFLLQVPISVLLEKSKISWAVFSWCLFSAFVVEAVSINLCFT